MAGEGIKEAPGKRIAENWSRPDKIRAGAVSGPWRSAPRKDPEPASVEAPAHSRVSEPPGAADRGGDLPASHALQSHPHPADSGTYRPESHPAGARTGEPESRSAAHLRPERTVPLREPNGNASAIWAVIIGVIFAIGLTAGAVYLRPVILAEEPAPALDSGPDATGPEFSEDLHVGTPDTGVGLPDSSVSQVKTPADAMEDSVPDAAETAGTMIAPVSDEAAPESAPALAKSAGQVADIPVNVRLRLHVNMPESQKQQLIMALGDLGYRNVETEDLSFRVALTRVGYYHPEDLPFAEALADSVAPILGESRDTLAVRNYRELQPDAASGKLDLWIRGE